MIRSFDERGEEETDRDDEKGRKKKKTHIVKFVIVNKSKRNETIDSNRLKMMSNW